MAGEYRINSYSFGAFYSIVRRSSQFHQGLRFHEMQPGGHDQDMQGSAKVVALQAREKIRLHSGIIRAGPGNAYAQNSIQEPLSCASCISRSSAAPSFTVIYCSPQSL